MRNVIASWINTARFTWIPTTREFVAEISELHGANPPGHINALGRLYDDAADTGFVLVSQKTNVGIPFYLVEEQRDADRVIKLWKFLPCFEALRRNPGLEGVSVIILND